MATHADEVGWLSDEPARPMSLRILGRRGTIAGHRPLARRRSTAPSDRKALARCGARGDRRSAALQVARADSPIGAPQMTDLPKTFRVKSLRLPDERL